ncbi:hypothetical protein [Mycolicibacterium fortuitum]
MAGTQSNPTPPECSAALETATRDGWKPPRVHIERRRPEDFVDAAGTVITRPQGENWPHDHATGVLDISIRDLRDGVSAVAAHEDLEDDPYDVVHIVGWWQDVMGRILRLKVPRALCGELLVEDPDRPGPSADSPGCRLCRSLNGEGRHLKRVHRFSVLSKVHGDNDNEDR